MKKQYVYVLLAMLGLSLHLNAQSIELGVIGGAGGGKYWGNEVTRQFHRMDLSYASGLYARYHLNQRFALSIGAGIENRPTKTTTLVFTDITGAPTGQTGHSEIDLLYASVPITLQLKFGNQIQPFISAGTSLGYLISTKEKTFVENTLLATSNNHLALKKVDISTLLGMGVMVPINEKFVFSVEWRNSIGLTNISELPLGNGSLRTFSSNALIGFGIKI